MSFLLDTNVLSELRRRDKADAKVVAWSRSVPAMELYLSVISIVEIQKGALLIERRDPAQGAALLKWINSIVIPAFADRLLPVDVATARHCARLHVPDPRSERDAFIAATAIAHDLTVVTRDIKDFSPMGVRVLNPWDAR